MLLPGSFYELGIPELGVAGSMDGCMFLLRSCSMSIPVMPFLPSRVRLRYTPI